MSWSARRRVLAAGAALVTLSLTACGAGDPASTLDERAHWSQLSLPKTAAMSGPEVDLNAVLGAEGDLPALLAASGADPGEADRARVWTDTGSGTWAWKDLPVADKGSSAASVATTDGRTTWVAGTTWQAGEPIQPVVFSSSDRSSWTAVELPDEALETAVEPGAAVPLAGGVLVVGKDGDGRPVAVRTGDDDALVVLPAAPDSREFHGFTGVAAHGDTVVATALAAAPGATDESVVY